MTQAIEAGLDERYCDALAAYLEEGRESDLLRGYEFGRDAISKGMGVLELAMLHSQAVRATLNGSRGDLARLLDAQTAFFIEALSPFEMVHRGVRDGTQVVRRLNEMLEAQAKRIAYALHSEAGQLLASVHFALAEAERGMPPANAAHLGAVRALLGEIEVRLRNLSHELRPTVLEDLGLATAIELLADSISKRWGLPVDVRIALHGDFPATIENTVYRIIQEALTNAAKHAGASQVEVVAETRGHKIVFSIRDDGTGFDSTEGLRKRRPGLGLTEIRERVASLGGVVRLGLNNDRGTDITIELPLDT